MVLVHWPFFANLERAHVITPMCSERVMLAAIVKKVKSCNWRFAELRGTFQDGVKHWLLVIAGSTDDFEYLTGRRFALLRSFQFSCKSICVNDIHWIWHCTFLLHPSICGKHYKRPA